MVKLGPTADQARNMMGAPSVARRVEVALEKIAATAKHEKKSFIILDGEFWRPRPGLTGELQQELSQACGILHELGYNVSCEGLPNNPHTLVRW